MTSLSDHECPNCKTTLGRLRSVHPDGRIEEGLKEDTYSVCIVCGTFLKVISYHGTRAQVRVLSEEEILAMPDDERIAMQRISNRLGAIPPEILKEAITRHSKIAMIYDSMAEDLTRMVEAELEKHFGEKMGVVIIVKDPRNMGFQGVTRNMRDDMTLAVVKRAILNLDGTAEKMMAEVLGG